MLKAVRCRNAELVQLLVDKRAKVSASDKKGDTALHIAMRAQSRTIAEILLRNPKHSHLLYRRNRAGESPYNIDISHEKTILGQIFGARELSFLLLHVMHNAINILNSITSIKYIICIN